MKITERARAIGRKLRDDSSGASLVEYSLLVALIALVAVVAIRFFGGELSTAYTDIANSFP